MWVSRDEMAKESQAVLDEALRHGFVDVEAEVQRQILGAIEGLQDEIEKARIESIARHDEPYANDACILGVYAEAIRRFISMWVHVKADEMDAAWEALISAQEGLACGLRLRPTGGLRRLADKLPVLEENLFSPMIFVSPSVVYGSSTCNICDEEYGECVHLAGRVYMGVICHAVIHDISNIDHVAIVRHPEDKRCRLLVKRFDE